MADRAEKHAPHVRLDERLTLRPSEAARALGVGERTLRQLLPILPHVRIGGVVLLPVRELREWLGAQAKSERVRAKVVPDEILAEMRRDA